MAEVTTFRNVGLPYPVYGAPWAVTFPMLDADGDLVTGATTPDAEVSKNGDTFADCTNESVEIATNSGIYYLILTATEMTADIVTVIAKSATAGMKTTVLTFYPRKLVSLRTGTTQGGSSTTIQLDASASAVDDFYNGCLCVAVIDSVTEARIIGDYTGSTKTATIAGGNWVTASPDADDTFTIYLPEGQQIQQANVTVWNGTIVATPATAGIPDVNAKNWNNLATVALPLVPATAGRSLVVDAAGLADANTVKVGPTGAGTAQTAGDLKASLNTIDDFIDAEVAAIITTLGAPAGASVSADIAAAKADTAAIKAKTDNLPTDPADQSLVIAATDAVMARLGAPAGASLAADIAVIESQTDDIGAAGAGLTALATQASVDDLPTNAELATSQAAADDATLAAIAALNNLSAAQVNTEVDTAIADAALATAANLATVAGYLDTEVAAILADTNDIQTRLPAALVGGRMDATIDGTGMEAGAIAALIEACFTYDATATYASADAGSLVKQIAGNAGGSGLTEAAIAAAVWDLTTTGHTTSGTFGAAMNAAGSAGDPWATALPGSYGAGTAGRLLGRSLPDVVAGGAGGLLIAGSNAATTFATLTVTGATTFTGNVGLAAGLTITQSSSNSPAIIATGNGTGAGLSLISGASGAGFKILGAGAGIQINTTAGDCIVATAINGHGINIVGDGTNKHGMVLSGGSAGTSDGLKCVAGTGGVAFRAATAIINNSGTWTGNIVGTVSQVTLVDTVTTYTGNTPQTGDSFTRIGAAGAGLMALGDSRIANLDAAITTRMATYTQPAGFLAATFPATLASTTNITAGTITTVTTLTNKTGFSLAATGLDSITATMPNGVATTFPEKVMALWSRFFGRVTRDSDEIKTYRSDGTTLATTQTYTAAGANEDIGAAV